MMTGDTFSSAMWGWVPRCVVVGIFEQFWLMRFGFDVSDFQFNFKETHFDDTEAIDNEWEGI